MGKGCGGDGGTTNATRADLVKLKKAPERIEKDTVNAMRWTLCALSQEALQNPVVVDFMVCAYALRPHSAAAAVVVLTRVCCCVDVLWMWC